MEDLISTLLVLPYFKKGTTQKGSYFYVAFFLETLYNHVQLNNGFLKCARFENDRLEETSHSQCVFFDIGLVEVF